MWKQKLHLMVINWKWVNEMRKYWLIEWSCPNRGGQRSYLPRVTSNYIIAQRTAQPQWLPTHTNTYIYTHIYMYVCIYVYTHTITGRHTLWDLTALICWFAEFDFRFSPFLPPLSLFFSFSPSHIFFLSIYLLYSLLLLSLACRASFKR